MKVDLYQRADSDEKREEVLKSLDKGLSEEDLARWAGILSWERDCIREGDVPYFCFLAGGRDLYGTPDSPALIRDFLEDSPIAYAKWRMERMCEQDRQVQEAYIKASLRHIDGWELPHREEAGNASGAGTELVQTVLSAEEAMAEVEETLRLLWEERIPLSGGCCLWHTPMIAGKIGSLFGLSEGFSGTAVFVDACTRAPLLTGEAAQTAKELHKACFQDLASFGEYLLETYPQPQEERIISRRFNGGFGFLDGLSGYVWALKRYRQQDPERTDRILEGFRRWDLEEAEEEPGALLEYIREGTATDCLEYGRAAGAAALLLREKAAGSRTEDLYEAGVILKNMVFRKNQTGCYQVFQERRRSYFLPAFLRGTTGIAYVLLLYANSRLHTSSSK